MLIVSLKSVFGDEVGSCDALQTAQLVIGLYRKMLRKSQQLNLLYFPFGWLRQHSDYRIEIVGQCCPHTTQLITIGISSLAIMHMRLTDLYEWDRL